MSKARPLPLNSSHATDPGDKQVARQAYIQPWTRTQACLWIRPRGHAYIHTDGSTCSAIFTTAIVAPQHAAKDAATRLCASLELDRRPPLSPLHASHSPAAAALCAGKA